MGFGMGFGIWDGIWDGIGDWDGIMTNGMGQMGFGMGFGWDGIWDSPIPINMGGKYRLDDTLVRAANWLKLYNPFLKSYSRLLDLPGSDMADPFPRAFHIPNDDSAPPFLHNDIVVPNTNFNTEIHNEDFHYTHLMAGFVRTPENTLLPLSVNDSNLEPLLFPDLFPNGKGHYHDTISNNNNGDIVCEETYSKYIKQRALNIDPRFRLNHKWLAWSYLLLEKIQKHQNNQRLWKQRQTNRIYHPPTAAELIQRSTYTNALSRCPNWSNIYIAALNPSAFITDQSMIEEYE